MDRTEADDSPWRAKIEQVVEDRPGCCIQELVDDLGLSRGAVRHHLQHLTKKGAVVSYRQGNHRLHFTARMPPMRRKAIVLLRIASVRATVEAIIEETKFKASDVAQEMDLTVRSVHRALKTLKRAGLMHSKPVKRGVYDVSFHPEMRIAWVKYAKSASRTPPLGRSPGWLLGFELLLAKLTLGDWAS